MRCDKSWAAGIHETAKMSSIQGLPTRGSDVTVLITRSHVHPLCVLVEFWAKFCQERTADYECLNEDIQSPGNTFQELEGNPGDQCLAQIDGTWHRSRIVSRNGSKYSVFLIDKGRTYSATSCMLAWGKKKHFHLPPEVEFCVLANVLPFSPENRWTPVALEFLKSLSGKTVKAHVQDVLLPHRTFLLHIPCIAKQMYEMGIAKKLSPDTFRDFCLMSLSGAPESSEIQISMGTGERLHKKEVFLYPEVPAGIVETVIVTEVTNPQRIFCQLKVFSQELKKLSGQITQCCEGRTTNCIVGPEMIGYPCAARGSDGKWSRSVLQQIFPSYNLVEVLNVDYGTKQFVQVENVRPLAAEFFRMPVVTYICSLHGVIDKGVGWTTSQVDYLRTLLLKKTVIAKFEYQSISEGVHYVTLYGDDNTNINNLFCSKECSYLEREKTLGDYAIRNTAHSRQRPAQQERKASTPEQAREEKTGKEIRKKLPTEDLSLNSSHVAVVQHISDPSEFWIQTKNYSYELDELMDSIYDLYKDSVNKDVDRNPTVGLYCAAKAEDGDFYRATVTEVGETQIKVFFVDYGNTKVVDKSNIRTLPDEFKKLPCLSLKCSLAGVRPKDGRWSQEACKFFTKAVTDKELTVHVMAKYDQGYVVQLSDPEAPGQKDLSALMCSSGLAERTEMQRPPKAKMMTQPAILPQLPGAWLSDAYRNKDTVGPASTERRISTFKEHMFPIGSVIDVSVSYIESPNDFWCQLVQNAGHLKLLMHDIQAHYAGSEFQPLVEMACIARHPDNQMWYRALVIHKHETPEVDVLFVDYGQMEKVSLYDLRRISPQFLALHGQAFRCSLLNPVDPTSAMNEWNDEAVARFHTFVETAASSYVILKCTVYAVMYSEQKIVFNIVDLETPFESICTSMVSLVKSVPPKKAAGPAFRLDTYYYSTHNVKTGTDERVTVTCVDNVGQFYCQLERNAEVINDLNIKVNNLCRQLENVKLPTVFGTLCFAKYSNGQWYRAQIKATKPALLVHFVDYGDTIEVEKSDLLPVPREANDIMSVPVQAVVCSLSDVPADVPTEVNNWFETSATECKFRALVVAREPDGKLQVELYHGNTQVNSKIKKMFQIELYPAEKAVHWGQRALEASASHAQKTPKVVSKQAAEIEDHTQIVKKHVFAPKPAPRKRDADMKLQSALKTLRCAGEKDQKGKAVPLELYRPPPQRQSCSRTPSDTGNGSEQAGDSLKPREESLPTDNKSPGTESQKESSAGTFPKLSDLPSKSITSHMEADVYVSHCNSPLSFYVQLVREEDEIFSLVETLSDPKSTLQTSDIKDVRPGDLVQAEFAEDSSWYRAVVREIHGESMTLVEFVDFGDTAMVPISKIGRLHESGLQLPLYSTHCMLSSAASLGKEEALDPEVVSAFKKDIGGSGEKVLKCQFIRQSGSVWEVSLEDRGVDVTCKVPARCSTDGSEKLEQVKEEPAQNSDIKVSEQSLLNSYRHQEFEEGQKLEVYITTVADVETFWSQPAVSEELDKITSRASEVGDAADHKLIDPGSLSAGTPCVAVFSDDHFWYRAEVLDKDGDKLSVLFVDYGNKSQVDVTDVREMPPDLMETPPQAFQCKLEGFDTSCGSWDSGAVDELSTFTADKVLQLTVTRVTRDEGNLKCLVRIECEGQVINEVMKTWWKSSAMEQEPAAVGLTASYETPLQCDSTVQEPENLEVPKGQEMDTTDELVDFHKDVLPCDDGIDPPLDKSDSGTEEEGASVMDAMGPEDFSSHEALDESEIATTDLETQPEEVKTCSLDLINLSVPVPTKERDDGKVTIARDNFLTSTTTVKMVPREVVCPRESVDLLDTHDHISKDLKQTEVMLPSSEFSVFDAATEHEEEEGDEVPEEELLHVESDLMTREETLAHHEEIFSAASDPQTCTAPSQDSGDFGEEVTCSVEEACLTDIYTDLNEPSDYDFSEVFSARDDRLSSLTAKEMVPCCDEAVCPWQSVDLFQTHDLISEDLQQIQTEVLLPSELPVFERESEAGCDVPKEELPCVTIHVESDLMTGEETLAHHEETYPGLLADFDAAASEPQTCTAPSQDSDDSGEEVTCFVEEACLTDVCTDPNESSGENTVTGVTHECLINVKTEEMVQDESPRPYRELPQLFIEAPSDDEIEIEDFSLQDEAEHDKNDSETEEETSALYALPSDTEPHTSSPPGPDLSDLVEEVTCLVGEICLTDVCREPGQAEETDREDGEQLLPSSPDEKEDFSEDMLEDETSVSTEDDDSFEAQLSKITHLSLIVIDGSADALLAEEKPEE